jgi:hypothetical protein
MTRSPYRPRRAHHQRQAVTALYALLTPIAVLVLGLLLDAFGNAVL